MLNCSVWVGTGASDISRTTTNIEMQWQVTSGAFFGIAKNNNMRVDAVDTKVPRPLKFFIKGFWVSLRKALKGCRGLCFWKINRVWKLEFINNLKVHLSNLCWGSCCYCCCYCLRWCCYYYCYCCCCYSWCWCCCWWQLIEDGEEW